MMGNVYDLKTEDRKGKDGLTVKGSPGPNLQLTNEQLPELDDFNIDENIELMVKGIIRKKSMPELKENVQNANEKATYEIELLTAGVINQKPNRKEADRMGVSMRSYRNIQAKRNGGLSPS